MTDQNMHCEHKTYGIIINATPTTVYTLLTSADQLDYNNMLTIGTPIQPLLNPAFNDEIRHRVPIDGYIVSVTGAFSASTSISGAKELIAKTVNYDCPVYFWLDKTWVSASPNAAATVRVYFN